MKQVHYGLWTMVLSRVVSENSMSKKRCHLEIGVRDHSRSMKVVPFDRLCMVSYQCSLVTLSFKRTVFEIFEYKNAVTLKTGLRVRQGHWTYHHSIECIDFLLMFYSNYGSISCCFWDIQYREMSSPWNPEKRSPFLRYSICKYTVTLKPGLEVTQGHRK